MIAPRPSSLLPAGITCLIAAATLAVAQSAPPTGDELLGQVDANLSNEIVRETKKI